MNNKTLIFATPRFKHYRLNKLINLFSINIITFTVI